MRKLPLVLLSALLASPLTALLGRSNARGDAGDESLAAFTFGDYSRALELAKPAAQKDDFMAQFVLARIHEEGKGVPKDNAEAAKWFEKTSNLSQPAAKKGDPRAQFVIGRMHHAGWYLPKNLAQAVAWYRKSAEQGYAIAQVNLGWMYTTGHGVSKNEDIAVTWIRKAAEQGFAMGQTVLGRRYQEGQGVTKDDAEALAWFRKAADQGYAEAQTALGLIYQQGRGISRDEKEAVAWFRKAAEQGNAMAQQKLGWLYQEGLGVSMDDHEAAAWYHKSASQGYAYGQANLGIMFLNGRGVAKNLNEAAVLFRKAAEQGNALAQLYLGLLHHQGVGVDKDEKEAVAWYRKAAEQGNAIARKKILEMEQSSDGQTLSPAPESITKEDIRDMIQSALKSAEAPTPKAIASDVDIPGYTTPENSDNFAVVIGVEKYASLPAADFAERDAESMRAHLMAMGYPARNIFFLSGPQATRAKIAQSVNTWLPGRVTAASTVFFYYSGHGAPDPQTNQAYLVPMDGDPEDLDSTAYPIKLLYEKLGKLKSKQVIVALDSCFSGAGGRSVLAKGTRPLVGKIDMGGLPDNVVALTASDKSQISGTIEEQGHGAFTYYMLKGLEGGAKNGAGRVTAQSLHDYLTPKVRDTARLSNREQTPQLMNGKGAEAELR